MPISMEVCDNRYMDIGMPPVVTDNLYWHANMDIGMPISMYLLSPYWHANIHIGMPISIHGTWILAFIRLDIGIATGYRERTPSHVTWILA